jgi:hypothetical protein
MEIYELIHACIRDAWGYGRIKLGMRLSLLFLLYNPIAIEEKKKKSSRLQVTPTSLILKKYYK